MLTAAVNGKQLEIAIMGGMLKKKRVTFKKYRGRDKLEDWD